MQPVDQDLEPLAAFFHGWRKEVIQLGPRTDRTLVASVSLRSHRILRLRAGSSLVVRGVVPRGHSALFLAASDQPVRFLGQPLSENEFVMMGEGATMDVFVPAAAVLCVLIAGPLASLSRRAMRKGDRTGARAEGVATLVQYVREPEQHRPAIDGSLAAQLRRAVTSSRELDLDRAAGSARVRAVLCACALVEKRFPAPIRLSDLARRCGVAERTLEYGFRQVYGVTPVAYIRSQRLTRNRRALLSKVGASISETARAFGFAHMGQYSRDYRRLFGETPSMTLARGRTLRERQPRLSRR